MDKNKSIKVTAEMISAGIDAIGQWESFLSSSSVALREEIVTKVFFAMMDEQESSGERSDAKYRTRKFQGA